jgi:crotonobetainyl-CoA:carnitine CoA-transferase CaiB-like acyl-CoA transferase
LADGITAQAVANAVLMALYHRDVHGGTGQVIDVAIIEPILTILGSQVVVYDQLGIIQNRTGNRSINNAPRNTYRTADGRWVAVSTSAQSVAERVMSLVGHPEVAEEPWFGSGGERAEHADELDEYVGDWIASRRLDEVVEAFEKAEAAVAPIYDVSQIVEDPQYQALGSIVSVDDPDLGSLQMQNVMFRMSDTPGRIRWAGRGLGQDNRSVYVDELGISNDEFDELVEAGVL